ncbi:hypothetical protein AB0I82_35495 [Streptomyces sp. NPDC050315]|uniref:hypothetical protein n=1 Tax=Streptomyces sp. NPDC050315 TaxID=3155039 RepID=UPI00342E12CF
MNDFDESTYSSELRWLLKQQLGRRADWPYKVDAGVQLISCTLRFLGPEDFERFMRCAVTAFDRYLAREKLWPRLYTDFLSRTVTKEFGEEPGERFEAAWCTMHATYWLLNDEHFPLLVRTAVRAIELHHADGGELAPVS